ncbi:histidine kinase [Lacibacter cauensis]|uniref:Histidine kinase n=1 Tax=Lacibacter cauensis TaxID=510947 RepID=A0A562SRF1_9BACT|nr:sensor histidine kinase [Lacibacter cauensis]TWI83396.1 histidine kinase [Lacibacter cauensis]
MNRSTAVTAGLHFIGWALFYSIILFFIANGNPDGSGSAVDVFARPVLFFFIHFPTIFYCNRFVLIPCLFEQKRYLLYALVFVALLLLMFWLKPFDAVMSLAREGHKGPPQQMTEQDFFKDRPEMPGPMRGESHFDIMSIILFLLVWLLSSAMFIFRQWRLTEQRALQAEAEKANAELSFLKAQVNPHFLFNTLNNIYSLAVSKSEHTADSIMKLSNIMRYITDDAREDKVDLQQEVDCIRDYIDLQQLRLGKNAQVMFTANGELQWKKIPPLLLMTFVENTFKYGVSNHEPSPIVIRIDASEKELHFETMNKLYEKKTQLERSGIGQQNALKRLQHMYPSKHTISIDSNGGFYTVKLSLQA